MPSLDFAALVQNYCRSAQLPAPVLINGVSCCIEAAGRAPVVIAWDETRDDVVIIVPLSEQPMPLSVERAQELLSAAFVGQDLDGAAIGLDPATGVLSLWRRLASEAATLTRLALDIERTSATALLVAR